MHPSLEFPLPIMEGRTIDELARMLSDETCNLAALSPEERQQVIDLRHFVTLSIADSSYVTAFCSGLVTYEEAERLAPIRCMMLHD